MGTIKSITIHTEEGEIRLVQEGASPKKTGHTKVDLSALEKKVDLIIESLSQLLSNERLTKLIDSGLDKKIDTAMKDAETRYDERIDNIIFHAEEPEQGLN